MGQCDTLRAGQQLAIPAATTPAITSAEYAQEVNQVEMLGGTTSTVRTADQTAIARFWSDLPGTFDPPGHWNQITEIAAIMSKTNLENSARAFALVDIALADSGIEAWNVKYTYNTIRPVTVIRDGADGVNPLITADPTWTPLWNTPAFPSYISGHSTFTPPPRPSSPRSTGITSRSPTPAIQRRTSPRAISPASRRPPRKRGWPDLRRNPFYVDNIYGLQVGGEVGQYVVQHELLSLKSGKS